MLHIRNVCRYKDVYHATGLRPYVFDFSFGPPNPLVVFRGLGVTYRHPDYISGRRLGDLTHGEYFFAPEVTARILASGRPVGLRIV